jgi:hypothetical protein
VRDIVAQVTDRGPGGHILTGPVFVEGADSGDVLEVKVLSIDLAIPYGYNGCSGFARDLCDRSQPTTRIIRLDAQRMIGHFSEGIEVPLKPFFGSMGVAPPASRGRVSSNPPDIHAGNLDNKELIAGTTLYIPVHVKGALFEVGDGHAAQGDGEVDQTAIETSLRGRPEGHEAGMAEGRNADSLDCYGNGLGVDQGYSHRNRANGEAPDGEEEPHANCRLSTRQHCRRPSHYAAGRRQRRCSHDGGEEADRPLTLPKLRFGGA